jgi:hypothetical protein
MQLPQEISEREQELGFRLMLLPFFDSDRFDPQPPPTVVVKILNSCEIIVKDFGPVYRHFRWGRMEDLPENDPQWFPLRRIDDAPTNPELAIHEASLGYYEHGVYRIIGTEFDFQK